MLRSLIKNWQLNSIAVLSLAVAMAVGVVAMSVSNAILLRPPYAYDPDRLVTIYAADRAHGGNPGNFSYPEYQYFREHVRSFSSVTALPYSYSKQIIHFGGRDELVMLNGVSANYFEVMGIRPLLGRFFERSREQAPEAILTYACWQRWGADRGILGKTITVDRRPWTIIGVAPQGFIAPVFGIGADLIEPIETHLEGDTSLEDLKTFRYLMIGRLNAGATRGQARAELQSLWGQLAAEHPEPAKNRAPGITGLSVLSPDSMDSARAISAVLIACSLLILLIACANTANLLLALATLRRQEALIKTALGAPRGRLIGEFLRETAVLCAAGGVFGYLLALAALHWLSRFDMTVPPFGTFPIHADLHPGTLVAACTAVLIVGASLISGLAPALYASKPNLASALTGEIAIGGTRRGWIRNTVVAVQMAVSTLALAGTGLCLQSLHNLRAVDPGFSARKIAAAWIFLYENQVKPEQGAHLFAELRRGAAAIPGVEAVALASDLPLGGDPPDQMEIRLTDRPDTGQKTTIGHSVVDENYFATMGIRILDGRVFRPSTTGKGPEEVVINQLAAERFWPHQNPVGRNIQIVEGKRTATVVGVAANGRYGDLDEQQQTYLYRPLDRNYQNSVTLITRTSGDPRLWFDPLSRAVRQAGIQMPLPPMSMDDWMNLTLFLPRMSLFAVSGLSVLAVLLATVGLYGAISYSVRERRRELGIRIALGASPSQVMQLVFRRTIAIAGTGVLLGMGLGSAAGAIFRSQFYRIHTVEWKVLAPVAIAMTVASLAISYAAARRWTRMNPMDTVRHV
jgi:macrolide transport system ATP-binding/permease protein